MLRNVRMVRSRVEALAPPNTAPITCFCPRRTEATRLKPEALRVAGLQAVGALVVGTAALLWFWYVSPL